MLVVRFGFLVGWNLWKVVGGSRAVEVVEVEGWLVDWLVVEGPGRERIH